MLIGISLFIIVFLVILIFLNQPQFGRLPKGERLERIKRSPNYKNAAFQNLSNTPVFADEVNFFKIMKDFLFKKNLKTFPGKKLPSVKTNLLDIDINEDILIWFGHSSYFIQMDMKRILVDPVLSGRASPMPFGLRAFHGSDIFKYNDLPEIDYLLISHDHWDHLDYNTVKNIQTKVKKVICGLGVGEHFEYWGYDKNKILESDWYDQIILEEGLSIHLTPARHFSGRGLIRNKVLWSSFVLKTNTYNIFMSGDGGYDSHFKEIGEKFGPFDLAILEQGQYNENWKYIHLMPDKVFKTAQDLQAKSLFPIHNSKFKLSNHPWNEPLVMVTENNKGLNIPVITPMIGEKVNLKNSEQVFSDWWNELE